MINTTTRTLFFYSPSDVRGGVVNPDAKPILRLDPSTRPLEVYSKVNTQMVDGYPLVVQEFTHVDNPFSVYGEAAAKEKLIVSNLYAQVSRTIGMADVDLYTVYNLVRDQDNNIVGCLGLEKK